MDKLIIEINAAIKAARDRGVKELDVIKTVADISENLIDSELRVLTNRKQ
jgi:hypothetical protein